MNSLRPRYRGRASQPDHAQQRQQIVGVAGVRPDRQGVPLTRWSLSRLPSISLTAIVEVSARHLGVLLAEAGLSFQRTRTWKASPDPDYQAKTARILALCATAPPDGGVLMSFNQMGPVSLRPTTEQAGRRASVPSAARRLPPPARHPLCLRCLRRARRPPQSPAAPTGRGSDVLAFMRRIRACYPARRRIYWIQDNRSANWTPDIRTFAAVHN
jgi:hypothetical protein